MKKMSGISKNQCKDTGMAAVLICLLLAYWTRGDIWLPLAIGLLIADMTVPAVFRPAAVLWFGLAELLGAVVSKILLTLLFFLLVTPVGVVRNAMGADPMKLKQWKNGGSSVFKERNHRFQAEDLEKPW